MTPQDESSYRLNLAEGYLGEAEGDSQARRWRSCAANAQLSIENSAKAVIAGFGPVALTHDPAPQLAEIAARQDVAEALRVEIRDIVPIVARFGSREHILFSYGDAATFRDPWAIVTEATAIEALDSARRCLAVAREVSRHLFGFPEERG